jgi:hypothetical protein
MRRQAAKQWRLMGFLVSFIAYLGSVTGIVLALILPLGMLLSAPDQSTVAQQAVATAPKPSELATAANAEMKLAPAIGRREPRMAPACLDDGLLCRAIKSVGAGYARRRMHAANETSRKQALHLRDRQERTGYLAYQQEPSFETRFLGYLE